MTVEETVRPAEAAPPRAPGERFGLEFLAALGLFAACLLWYYRGLILTGGVNALEHYPVTEPRHLWSFSEMVYITQAAIAVQNRLLHEGVFPAWTPLAAGGTPLIAKMQNGFFGLHHLLLYALPLSWSPYLYTAVLALKSLLAFSFTYLLARCLRLTAWTAAFAAVWFVFSYAVVGGLFTWPGAALAFPLTLLLTELLFRRRAATGLVLLPWAFAIPFLSGHFESGVYNGLIASAYFVARQWGRPGGRTAKLRQAGLFGAAAFAGFLLCSVQSLAAIEYIDHSYSKVWHDTKFFGFWEWDTVGKHLTWDDAPMAALGWAGLGAFAFLARRWQRAAAPLWASASAVGSSASLAVAVACFANLGWLESLESFPLLPGGLDYRFWIAGVVGLALAFWAWRTESDSIPVKILGWLLLAETLIVLKTPVLVNGFLLLPLFNNFHNAMAPYRWEFHLARALLAAFALQRCFSLLAEPRDRRLRAARRFAAVLLIVFAGYGAGVWLKEPVGKGLASSVVWVPQQERSLGGFTAPERQYTFLSSLPVNGWLPMGKAVAEARAVALDGDRVVAEQPLALTKDAASMRYRFSGRLERSRFPPSSNAALQIRFEDGTEQSLRGFTYWFRQFDAGPRAAWYVAGAVAAAPLLLVLAPAALKAAFVALLLLPATLRKAPAMPADQIPLKLPGIERIVEDKSLYRVTSLEYNFLQADYPGVYGLADVRTGGDSIDVLTAFYFFSLLRSFLDAPQEPRLFDMGLKLLGLAGVKYLIQPPGQPPPPHAAVDKVYEGPDMSVWRNRRALPRALFFEQYAHMPLGDYKNWAERARILNPLGWGLAQGQLDPAKTLLLHDAPAETFPPSTPGRGEPKVSIEDYGANHVRVSVEAPRPGLVFLSDTFFPGWTAYRDGDPVPILRSWLNFRAVQVPQGRSTVEFAYRPLPLTLGALLTAAGALLWLLAYRLHRLGRLSWAESAFGVEPEPAKTRKAKKAALARSAAAEPLEAEPLDAWCALTVDRLLSGLVLANLLFWASWGALIFRGGRIWNGAALAVLAGAALVAWRDWRRRARPAP
ncbi:MAG: hypothetical protein HY554_15045 [Elusimicrobia bacterium]|nr:hypothetical protein [Elusimicrobiota bacterium]